jgi:protein-S-isoprenylcysteine O-methyltransferase Ste14
MVLLLLSSGPVLGLLFAGIAVRWTAIHALGAFFTGRVQIREGHTLIRTGLYSQPRHPAYAGSLLAYFGLGLAFSNWWILAAAFCPPRCLNMSSSSVAANFMLNSEVHDNPQNGW